MEEYEENYTSLRDLNEGDEFFDKSNEIDNLHTLE